LNQNYDPIIAIISMIVFTVGVGFSTALVYYFLFSKNSFLRKKFLEKKLNKIATKEVNFININGITFMYDKKQNKYIAL